MTDFNPSIRPCVLYQRESAKGNMYLSGNWGGLKMAVVKTSKSTEDGQAIWNVLLSEKPQQNAHIRAAESLADKVRASYEEKDFTLKDDEVPY